MNLQFWNLESVGRIGQDSISFCAQQLPWSWDPSWPAGSSVLTGGLSDCCSHGNLSWTWDMISELSWSCPSSSGHPLMGEDKKMSVTRCWSFNLLAVILLLFSSAGKTSRWGSDYMSLRCSMYCFSFQNDWHSREWTKMSVYNNYYRLHSNKSLFKQLEKLFTFLLTAQFF